MLGYVSYIRGSVIYLSYQCCVYALPIEFVEKMNKCIDERTRMKCAYQIVSMRVHISRRLKKNCVIIIFLRFAKSGVHVRYDTNRYDLNGTEILKLNSVAYTQCNSVCLYICPPDSCSSNMTRVFAFGRSGISDIRWANIDTRGIPTRVCVWLFSIFACNTCLRKKCESFLSSLNTRVFHMQHVAMIVDNIQPNTAVALGWLIKCQIARHKTTGYLT